MDWYIVFSAFFSALVGMNIGIRLERHRIALEEVVYLDELPEEDAEYWRKQYEDLAEEWDYEFKVKVTEGSDAQGETTE